MTHRLVLVVALSLLAGCQSPYRADRGALAGGLVGAGTGAIIGNAVGHTGPGAAIGAAVGTLTGAAVGQEMDDIEARNRAEIEARMGQMPPPGAVGVGDVIAMSRAGVSEEVIVNHVQTRGMAVPLQTNDLIALQREGVSPRVVQAMQQPIIRGASPVPPPMIVPQPVYAAPVYYPPPYPYYYGCGHRPHVGWGISFSGH